MRRFLLFLFLTVLLPLVVTPELRAATATPVDLAVAAPVAISFAAPVTASPEAPVPPQSAVEKVIHVWVDPIYGDDTLAAARNPNQTQYCDSKPTYPVDYVDTGGLILLHAAWPFKTVTAAIAYIPTLPTLPSITTGVVWKYAVIHCLPGMYAQCH